MEKISSILPNNKRVKSVDVDESHPAVPGATTLGRSAGSTAGEREKLRVKAMEKAEQAKAMEALSQAKDNVSFSEQGKQAAHSDVPAGKLEANESLHASTPALKAYVEEMAGEPSFEKMISADNIKDTPLRESSEMTSMPKPAAPSFFVDTAPKTASAHSLDKYA